MSKIFLGTTRDDFENYPGEKMYLSKHSWDCEWYWGFGYIGNKSLHTHFDCTFLGTVKYTPQEIFETPHIDEGEWWVLRDLFVQAYALGKAAEVYQYGGHQTPNAYRLENNGMSDKLNKDLEIILEKIWDLATKINDRILNRD